MIAVRTTTPARLPVRRAPGHGSALQDDPPARRAPVNSRGLVVAGIEQRRGGMTMTMDMSMVMPSPHAWKSPAAKSIGLELVRISEVIAGPSGDLSAAGNSNHLVLAGPAKKSAFSISNKVSHG